jgi:hypothetical protein
MIQYFIQFGMDGEDFDLFVTAESPEKAVDLWLGYYGFETDDENDEEIVRLRPVPAPAFSPVAHKWDDIPEIQIKVRLA